jgi:dihydropyrimidinase
MDFIIPGPDGLIAAYNDWRSRADSKVNCDYALHCAITDWNDKISLEMGEIVKRGV